MVFDIHMNMHLEGRNGESPKQGIDTKIAFIIAPFCHVEMEKARSRALTHSSCCIILGFATVGMEKARSRALTRGKSISSTRYYHL